MYNKKKEVYLHTYTQIQVITEPFIPMHIHIPHILRCWNFGKIFTNNGLWFVAREPSFPDSKLQYL